MCCPFGAKAVAESWCKVKPMFTSCQDKNVQKLQVDLLGVNLFSFLLKNKAVPTNIECW